MNYKDLFDFLNGRWDDKRYNKATPSHGGKRRGVGITRKNKEQSKKRRKMANESRRRNRRAG